MKFYQKLFYKVDCNLYNKFYVKDNEQALHTLSDSMCTFHFEIKNKKYATLLWGFLWLLFSARPHYVLSSGQSWAGINYQ